MIDYSNALLIDISGNAQNIEQIALRYDGEVTNTVLLSQIERLCYQRYLEPLYHKTPSNRKKSSGNGSVVDDDEQYQMYYRYIHAMEQHATDEQDQDDEYVARYAALERSLLSTIREEWISKAKLLVKAAKMNNTVTQSNAVEHLLKILRLTTRDLNVLRYWSTGFWKR